MTNMTDMNFRDSIITSSHDANNKANCIEGWSFLDASVLCSLAPPTQTGVHSVPANDGNARR